MPNRRRISRIAGCRQQHDHADHSCIQYKYHRRINCIIEVRPFHGGIAVADAPVIALLHIGLHSQCAGSCGYYEAFPAPVPDTAATARRLSSCAASIRFCTMTGKHGKQRQHQKQKKCQSGVFHRNDRQDRNNAARIRRHADDTGGKQRLYRIHISRKPRSHLSGILLRQSAGRQALSASATFLYRSACVIFCPNSTSRRFLCRGQARPPAQGCRNRAAPRQSLSAGFLARQTVDRTCQQERRESAKPLPTLPHTEACPTVSMRCRPHCHANGRKYTAFYCLFFMLLSSCLAFVKSAVHRSDVISSSSWVPTAVFPSSIKITFCICGK